MGEPALKNKPGLSSQGTGIIETSDLKIYHTQSEDVDQYEPANTKLRFFAALVDAIFFSMLVKVIMGFLLHGLFLYVGARSRIASEMMGLTVLLMLNFYYFAWPLSEWGQTLGKKFFNLRVVNTASHHDLGILQAFARETVGKTMSLAPLGFGFIMVLFDKKRLALHDKLMKTKVIKYR